LAVAVAVDLMEAVAVVLVLGEKELLQSEHIQFPQPFKLALVELVH
tara:strand:- start:272 stop:409 length:138 start_codon:yes stop_codon:yes gene_type:complete